MELAAEDKSLVTTLYRQLMDRPLQPGDAFYEPIYGRPEGEDPIAKLRMRIELMAVESVQLFSGFRGTGKTTELFRLRKQLQDRGFLVLYADALDYVSSSEEIDISTLLMALAGAFGEQLEHAGGAGLAENFWERIRNYLTKTTLQVSEANVKVEASPLIS